MAELVWFETDEELQSAAELVLKILNVTELRVTTGWVDYHEDILGQCNYHLPYATCKVRLKPKHLWVADGALENHPWIIPDHAWAVCHEVTHVATAWVKIPESDRDAEEVLTNRIAMAIRPEFVRRWNSRAL